MAVLPQLEGEPKYTLLLMRGEEMMSSWQKIYILEEDSLQ